MTDERALTAPGIQHNQSDDHRSPSPPAGGSPLAVRCGQPTFAYDPDLGPVPVVPFPAADKAKWAKAVNEGPWLAYPEDGAPDYHEVFALQLAGKYRYVCRHGHQHGPQHQHLVAAIYWAFGHGWRDPALTPDQNVRCHVEMRNSRLLGERGIDLDAWRPNLAADRRTT